MKKIISFFFSFYLSNIVAQDSIQKPHLQITAYGEIYYSYDFGKPANHEKPSCFYNFKMSNEVNVNLAFLKANYNDEQIRGSLALMVGNYAQFNLASEPTLLQNIYEANAGVKPFKKHNFWIDAGVLVSHLGFETPVGKDCWALTRCIASENMPYYQTGIQAGYTTTNKKAYMALMYLNGWQRIQRVPGNQTPAFGSQVLLKPNRKLTFNWSTYVGNDQPDSVAQWRVYNDFYLTMVLTKKLQFVVQSDFGYQQQKKDTSAFNNWYTHTLILRYDLTKNLVIAGRFEYYTDPNQVVINTGTPYAFQTFGYSLNFDYHPTPKVVIRLEGRYLNSKYPIFILDNQPSRENYCLSSSIAFAF